MSVSVELHHTGIRYYEHHQFTSGQTLREVLIGDPLGPDAGGGYVDVGWCASARQRFTLEGAVERRSNDQYESFSSGATFGFRRIQLRPKEWRGRLLASWRKVPERGGLGLHVEAGYERARNFNFSEGVNRDGVLARVALEYRFR